VLRFSLRVPDGVFPEDVGSANGRSAILNKSNKSSSFNVQANPPTFYDNDLEKWKGKYSKAVQDRHDYKKKHYTKLELTSVTVNTNLQDTNQLYQNSGFQTSLGFVSTA
jgi:hypothetical protein